MLNPYREDTWDESITNPEFEACVLSERLVAEVKGDSWEWQGLMAGDFQREDYREVFKACRLIEGDGLPCTLGNVAFVAEVPVDRLKHIHDVWLYYDYLWSFISGDRYDFISALKSLTKKRTKRMKNGRRIIS